MQRSRITIPWADGLQLRQVVKLVKVAHRFHSTILLKCRGEVADLRRSSIITVVALCAMANALELEVAGDDEQAAARSVEQVFLG